MHEVCQEISDVWTTYLHLQSVASTRMGSQERLDKLLFSTLTPCVVLSEPSVHSLTQIPLFLSMRQDLT